MPGDKNYQILAKKHFSQISQLPPPLISVSTKPYHSFLFAHIWGVCNTSDFYFVLLEGKKFPVSLKTYQSEAKISWVCEKKSPTIKMCQDRIVLNIFFYISVSAYF